MFPDRGDVVANYQTQVVPEYWVTEEDGSFRKIENAVCVATYEETDRCYYAVPGFGCLLHAVGLKPWYCQVYNCLADANNPGVCHEVRAAAAALVLRLEEF